MSIYKIDTVMHMGVANECRTTAHYEFFSYIPSITELQEFIDNLDAAYKVELQSFYPNEIGFDSYDVRRVDTGDLPTVQFIATAGAWVGLHSGDPLPYQTAPLVTFGAPSTFPRTTRTYLLPPVELYNGSSGDPDGVWITACEAWADAVFELDVTGQVNPDKVAVKYGGTPRAVIADNEVETRVVKTVWASQRRRRIGI